MFGHLENAVCDDVFYEPNLYAGLCYLDAARLRTDSCCKRLPVEIPAFGSFEISSGCVLLIH